MKLLKLHLQYFNINFNAFCEINLYHHTLFKIKINMEKPLQGLCLTNKPLPVLPRKESKLQKNYKKDN